MLPGVNGLVFISPLLMIFNILFKRKLHYVVIGGWLPQTVSKKRLLRAILRKFDNIMVETQSMKEKMEDMIFHNVTVMPNCKRLKIVSKPELKDFKSPYPLCTFSRVIKEKGIEDAIEAIKACNKKLGFTAFTLDVYGQIGNEYREDFNKMMTHQPEYIRYCGCVSYSDSTKVLRNYFALLFPTYYQGECFAGTVIDAFSAGLPVIASDWHDNRNIIKDKKTGIIFPVHSVSELSNILVKISNEPSLINNNNQWGGNIIPRIEQI